MICKCGGYSDYERQVVRDKKIVAKYQKCPACKRVLLTWGEFPKDEDKGRRS